MSPEPDDAAITALELATGLPVPDDLRSEVLLHVGALRRAHEVVVEWRNAHADT